MKSSVEDIAHSRPAPAVAIGVTGHRASHPSYPQDTAKLDQALVQIFAIVEEALTRANSDYSPTNTNTRLLTLLSDGTDHLAAELALARNWDLVCPLPFGRRLNAAINSGAKSAVAVRSILAGQPTQDPIINARISAISALADQGTIFELADRDARLAKLLLSALGNPDDPSAQHAFASESGHSAALAGRVLIEHSDLVVAVWDGQSTANLGGTGHTALRALESGVPVLWIDPTQPSAWQLLSLPEELLKALKSERLDPPDEELRELIEQLVGSSQQTNDDATPGMANQIGTWRDSSSIFNHAFRRVEALFGQTDLVRRFASIRQNYEWPASVAEGSAKPLLNAIQSLTPENSGLRDRTATQILERFAWLDGVSARLSDRHRSGMIINFLLGTSAIVVGILYLPLVDPAQKWIFAAIELILLLLIVANTMLGRKLNLHARWLETRRAAEYLRHSPILAATGVGRPRGVWPQGVSNEWPEQYARNVARAVGLPDAKLDYLYLRTSMTALRDHHVDPQREYHAQKSAHLDRVHRGLDNLSERLFKSAIAVVGLFLILTIAAQLGWFDPVFLSSLAKWFTVLAVALPTLGGAFAGIRYFGDFERFAEISQVTAQKLDTVAKRIEIVLEASDEAITFDRVAEIVRATDQIVFDEIQNWQAVFRTKIIAVPA